MEKWQDPQTIALWLAVIFLLISTLAGSLVLLVRNNFSRIIRARLRETQLKLSHQRELLTVSFEAGEQEKLHIASELHDHFGVNLSTLKIWIEQFYTAPEDSKGGYYNRINELIDRNISDVRGLSHEIYPPMLREWGLMAALAEIREDLQSSLRIVLFSSGTLPGEDHASNLQLFRICQEFIQNSIRHGKATTVTVLVRSSAAFLSLCIYDDGEGFDQNVTSGGFGVKNMLARSEAISATARLRSAPGKSTTFTLIKKL